ncbi:membrane protein [Bacteroidia bacterium]|nr:membrane protein [Bacteroidia bacterium]GHV07271.1 membrane protein [Bacteroidia bacterium]
MLKINKIVAVSLFVIVPLTILAQNNTNSPYTRFGYGELADRSFGTGRAMGGIGYGLRSNKQINPMNPASYTSTDSLTFLFDFGLAGQLSWFDDGVNKEKHTNGNLEYIALQFPVHRRIAVSAGILPYSYVGYNFASLKTSEQGISYSERFIGSGGLNEIYAGVSIDIWKKRLSLGANVGYMFGKIAHTQALQIDGTGANSSSRTQNLKVNDLKLDLGLQYTHPVSAKESYTFGLVFSPGKKLNSFSTNTAMSGSAITGQDTTNQAFDIPNSFGAGISYVKQNKLTLAADILYENWANARFFDKKDDFKNRIRVAAGGEYIPNYQNRFFFSRIRYRAGVHYSNSYLNVNESSYNEMGASIGLGLPLIDQRSYLNLSFEYVKIKPESRMLIDEQYLRFTVNYTFNERWFFKFKVN